MKELVIIFSLCFFQLGGSQVVISGKVLDGKKQPIPGANVYLEGTYDGATTDDNGEFLFSTEEQGKKALIVSFLSYETKTIYEEVTKLSGLKIILREDVESLETVVLNAGTFEANDNSKVSVLKPLDVVTTASALGDFVGALQTLPGTSNNAEDGRLFVRGGAANETQIFIDGIRVFTPFTPTTNNFPTRGRYSPFLFDGITFSTGGYSAEYGQALSSVLLLNTIDEPDQEKTDISIMTVGAALGNTQKWGKSSLSFNASYTNLAPYFEIFDNRNTFQKPFQAAQGEMVFRQKLDSGLFKFYSAFDTTTFQLTQEDINFEDGINFGLNNRNFYLNSSYRGTLGNGWSIQSGLSFTHDNTKNGIEDITINSFENSAHLKLKLKKRFSSRFKLGFGAERFITGYNETFSENDFNVSYGFDNTITAGFAEADVIFSKKLALKTGVRADYSSIFKTTEVGPRMALAYKTSKNGQFSLAYGNFFQNPGNDILRFNQDLEAQKTTQYILNYQYVNDGRIFRAEAYRKDYDNLVKFDGEFTNVNNGLNNTVNTSFNSSGDGYAQGVDLFWRDNTSIKNLDYWVSYSYLDTKRNHLNFPEAAQPNFASNHNFSIVGKYWIDEWKSQLGIDYTFASGRPYNNPNTDEFLSERTKPFNSISLNWAYLIDQQKILYFSVNNVLGFRNINGYQYSNTPNANGQFDRLAFRPATDQFFFIGFFWTISEDGKDNQLDNL